MFGQLGGSVAGVRRGDAVLLPLVLVVTAYLSFSGDLFNDGDTSWHLAAGRLMLDTGSIPQSDPFSFTFAGAPWTAHEWLAEAIMAAAFAGGSWGGLSLLFALAIGSLMLILGLELGRQLAPQRAVAALLVIFMLLAPFILARPHVLAWPLLAGWTLLLLRAREAGRAPAWPAALLMMVWANLHGSFVFGLLLVAVFALEALIQEQDRRSAILHWGLFGLGALLMSLLTPHGLQGLIFPLQVSGMKSLPLIMEWRRIDPAQDWLFLLFLAAAVVLLILRRPRITLVRLALFAGMSFLALAHARHQPLLVIVGALILVAPVPLQKKEGGDGGGPPLLAGGLVVGLILIAAVRLSQPMLRHDSASNPLAAIGGIPSELRSQRVLNSYSFGGPLIFEGIRPYIDGRADMYGDAFMFEHYAIMNGDLPAFRRAVARWDIGWTILAPGTPLATRLDREPGWRRIHADEWAVVHSAVR